MSSVITAIPRLVIEKILSIRFVVAVLSSILLSLLLTFIIAIITGLIVINATLPYLSPRATEDSATILTIFLACFFAFVILIYFLSLREDEDALTPIRNRLKGIWKVTYQTWRYDDCKVQEIMYKEICSIKVDQNAKLFFVIKTDGNNLYKGDEFRITDVAVNVNTKPIRLIYYYDVNLRLTNLVREKLKLESTVLEFPVLGVLSIDESTVRNQYQKMSGLWYDLDGVFTKFLEDLERCESNVQTIERLPRRGTMSFERFYE